MLTVELLSSFFVLLLLKPDLWNPAPLFRLVQRSTRSVQVVVELGVARTRAGTAVVPVMRRQVTFDGIVPVPVRTVPQVPGGGPALSSSPGVAVVDVAEIPVRPYPYPARRHRSSGTQDAVRDDSRIG